MNAQERKTLKRALASKEIWKSKARERQKGMRLLQLKIRDLERSRTGWKEKFIQFKNEPGLQNKAENIQTSKSSTSSGRQAKAAQKKN